MTNYVFGRVPYDNSRPFQLYGKRFNDDGTEIPESDVKPIVISAKDTVAAIELFTKAMVTNPDLTYRVPAKTAKVIVASMPDAFKGYKVHAVMSVIQGTVSSGRYYAIATVETVGTTETDETAKAAAKRIERETKALTEWLAGNAEIMGVPLYKDLDMAKAVTAFGNALKQVQSVSRMTAAKALKAELDKA